MMTDTPAGDDQREALARLADTFEAESGACQERAAHTMPDAEGDESEWYREAGAADAWQQAARELRAVLAARPSAPTITTEQDAAAVRAADDAVPHKGGRDAWRRAYLAALGIEVTP